MRSKSNDTSKGKKPFWTISGLDIHDPENLKDVMEDMYDGLLDLIKESKS